MLNLSYHGGTIVAQGDTRIPYAQWDPRVKAFRAEALYYREIVEFLKNSGFSYEDHVLDLMPHPQLTCTLQLRQYQQEAVDSWEHADRRGVIVLPTGSGKTVLAIAAIARVNRSTLIVAPTLDLVEQWRDRLTKEFNVEIGILGGGENQLRGVTVATYDSAYLKAGEIGNRFEVLVFDEVHHLAAPGFRKIAEAFTAPYRMGLTATYEREDQLHKDLPRLVGGKVFEMVPSELAGQHLAPYSLEKIMVDLTPEEQAEYDRHYRSFRRYIRKRRIRLRSPQDFRRFIMRTGTDPEARKALLDRNKALEIALNSSSKLETLGNLLKENREERVLVFTQHNQLVYRICRFFLLPAITHLTPRDERSEILSNFRTGKYPVIVTSKVLDEGIDVPDATMAVILSGTGSSREFIQRLGRILRPREGKKAKLLEIVSNETAETRISYRRRVKSRRFVEA